MSNATTIAVTTRNTTALTMGIAAVVLGIAGLLVGWIPFLGLLAIPVASIGGFLALMGLLLAALKKLQGWSMPLLGGIICTLAIVVSVSSTGTTSAALSEAVQETSKAINQRSNEAAKQEATTRQAEQDYIATHLALYETEAKYRESLLEGKVPGVLFKLKNNGSRTLNRIKIVCYFLDAAGNRIAEEDFYPVAVSHFSIGDNNKPLKPGYIWSMEKNRFYAAKSVPTEWKEGAVQFEIAEIEFAD